MITATDFMDAVVPLILRINDSAGALARTWGAQLGHVARIPAVSLPDPAGCLLMGAALLLVGRGLASRRDRQDAVASTPQLWALLCLVVSASLLVSCAKNPEAAKQAYVKSGDMYAAEGKYNEAIVQYRNAVQQDRQFGEAHAKLADAYAHVNEPAGAYREYIRAADLLPGDSDAQIKAGQMLLLANQFEDARTRADQVLATDPKHVQALVLRGAALAGLKDLDGAVAQVEGAIELDPDRSATYDSLGTLQLAKGNLERAEEAFTKAVEADGTSVPARLALARFYASTGRGAEAEDALEQTLDIDPSNPTANRALAVFYITSKRAVEAEPFLKTFAAVSKTAGAWLELADYYRLMQRPSDAAQILNRVVDTDPPVLAAVQARLAAIEYAGKHTKDAHKRLDDLLSKQPKNSSALLLKARFLLAEHQVDGALTTTQAATQADPKSAEALLLLGNLYSATSQPDQAAKTFKEVLTLNPRAGTARVELSRVQLAQGDVDASIQSVREALKDDPDRPDAHLLMARGLMARREWASVEHEMTMLLAKYPNVAAVHSQAGILHAVRGDRTAAKRSFERALELDGHSIEALSGLVGLDLTARKTAEALTMISATLANTPDDPRLLLLAAKTYAATGDSSRAEQTLRHALEVDPTDLQAHTLLGELLVSTQKLEGAKAEFEAVAKRRPGTATGLAGQTRVAVILEAQKRFAEAQSQYEQILAASPRSVVASNNLAWLYAEHGGNLDVALGLAQTAVQQAPNQPAMNDTLGWIYYKKGLSSQAIAAFQKSVEKDATNPLYHYHLGLAYSKQSNRAKAKQSLEKALALQPDFDGSSDARKVLVSITG